MLLKYVWGWSADIDRWNVLASGFLVSVALYLYWNLKGFARVSKDANGEPIVRASLSSPGLIEYARLVN